MRREGVKMTDEERYDAIMHIVPTRSYSIADASRLIGCSIRQIYLMMEDNRLPYEPATLKCPHRRIKGVRIREVYFNH